MANRDYRRLSIEPNLKCLAQTGWHLDRADEPNGRAVGVRNRPERQSGRVWHAAIRRLGRNPETMPAQQLVQPVTAVPGRIGRLGQDIGPTAHAKSDYARPADCQNVDPAPGVLESTCRTTVIVA